MRNSEFIPLFYHPSTWLYVDDDRTLLSCVKLSLKSYAHIQTFDSPHECINYLNNYKPQFQDNNYLKKCDEDECAGVLNYMPVDFDITAIAAIMQNENRHQEITAAVIDYHMPEMNGFLLSQAIKQPHIQKILLTGSDEESRIISGFNHNYIHRYVQKGQANMDEILLQYLQEISFLYFQCITSSLLSHIEAENPIGLTDPIFITFFKTWCTKNNIQEYYLIDKQGSFLCIDDKGNKKCLVMHTDRSIHAWMTCCEVENELDQLVIKKIKDRELIPFFGLSKEAWHVDISDWPSCLYPCERLEGRELYYWFVQNID